MASQGRRPDPGRVSAPSVVGPIVVLLAMLVSAVIAPSWMVERSLADFLLVTLTIGCGTSWLTGRAVARGWGSPLHLFVYCVLLACAVRFTHFALFEGDLLSGIHYLSELVMVTAVATLGFRAVRTQQMTERYGWLYRSAGPLAWQARTDGGNDPA